MSIQGGKEGQPQPLSKKTTIILGDDGEMKGLAGLPDIMEITEGIAQAAQVYKQELPVTENEMLTAMSQLEEASRMFGRLCVTVGRDQDRALVFRIPEVTKIKEGDKVYFPVFAVEYTVISRGGFSFATLKTYGTTPERIDELRNPDPYAARVSKDIDLEVRRFHEYLKDAAKNKNMNTNDHMHTQILPSDPGALRINVYKSSDIEKAFFEIPVTSIRTTPARTEAQMDKVRKTLTAVRSQIDTLRNATDLTRQVTQEIIGSLPEKPKRKRGVLFWRRE